MRCLLRLGLVLFATFSMAVTWSPDAPVGASHQPACQAVISSSSSRNVAVIDVRTSDVTFFAPSGVTVSATAHHPDGRLFAATTDGDVIVLSGHPNYELLITVTGLDVRQIAMAPNGQRLYSTSVANRSYSWIDTSTYTTGSAVLQLPYEPIDLAVSPNNLNLFTAGTEASGPTNSATMNSDQSWISLHHPTISASAIALSPDGSLAYFASSNQPNVLILETGADAEDGFSLSTEWTVASSPHGDIAISSDGSRAYITAPTSNRLIVVDTSSGATLADVGVGSDPRKVTLTPDGRFAFVSNGSSNTVSKVDLLTNTVAETITVADNPFDIAIGPPGCTSEVQTHTDLVESPSLTPSHRATLDPAGGTCRDTTPRTETWTSVFVGHRYLPNASDCTRPGYVFTGWNDTTTGQPTNLPLLTDPASGTQKHFLAADASLTATWAPLPAAITDLVVFANFFCGPCTNAWLIHSPSDHAAGYDYTVNSTPVTCVVDIEVFGLRACELTALSTGTPFTATVTPRNTHGTGPIRTTTFTLDF